jgi:hypothetical protein
MGTICAPLLADLFLYSYELEFLQNLVKDKKIHEARDFNFTYRYIDDILSMCPFKGDKYVIDGELQHTDHLFLRVACFTFLNFVRKIYHFWAYTSNLTKVVNSLLKFMINGMTSILKS